MPVLQDRSENVRLRQVPMRLQGAVQRLQEMHGLLRMPGPGGSEPRMKTETLISKKLFLARVIFLRFGLNRFAKDVNNLLAQGYNLKGFQLHHGLLRTFLFAELEKP